MIIEKPITCWPPTEDVSTFLKSKVAPFLMDVDEKELAKLYLTAIDLIKKNPEKKKFFIDRKVVQIKRSLIVFPKQNELFINLKREDLCKINSHIGRCSHPDESLSSIGIYRRDFLTIEQGLKKKCISMLRLQVSPILQASLASKLTTELFPENTLLNDKEIKKIKREIKYRKIFNEHAHTVHLEHHLVYEKKRNEEKVLKHVEISEYCHGDLYHWFVTKKNPLPNEKGLQSMCLQIASAIQEMHDSNVLHGDIKLENILVQVQPDRSWMYKLCDFGFTREVGKKPLMIGTPRSMSPERLQYYTFYPVVTESGIDKPDDIWAFGVFLYKLKNLQEPPWSDLADMLMQKISLLLHISESIEIEKLKNGQTIGRHLKQMEQLESEIYFLYNDYIRNIKKFSALSMFPPQSLSDRIMHECLQINPKDRITIHDIIALLLDK